MIDFILMNGYLKSWTDALLYCKNVFKTTLATPCNNDTFNEFRQLYQENIAVSDTIWIGGSLINGTWGYHDTNLECPVYFNMSYICVVYLFLFVLCFVSVLCVLWFVSLF